MSTQSAIFETASFIMKSDASEYGFYLRVVDKETGKPYMLRHTEAMELCDRLNKLTRRSDHSVSAASKHLFNHPGGGEFEDTLYVFETTCGTFQIWQSEVKDFIQQALAAMLWVESGNKHRNEDA